jgi:hypothetical protein
LKHPRELHPDVEAFARSVARGRGGQLVQWEAEIFHLLALAVSYRNICRFLSERGTTVSAPGLHKFVHAKKRAHLLAQITTRQSAGGAPATSPSRPTEGDNGSDAKATRQLGTTHAPTGIASSSRPNLLAPPVGRLPGEMPKFIWDPDSIDMKDLT